MGSLMRPHAAPGTVSHSDDRHQNQKTMEPRLSLKQWVKAHFGSQDKMDQKMRWAKKTTTRYLNHQPHRFFEYRHELASLTETHSFELVRMIDQREREILAIEELRPGDPTTPEVDVLSHRTREQSEKNYSVQGGVAQD